MLFHDRDAKFTAAVDADLAKTRIQVRKTAFRAPNTNAYVERFIQTVQQGGPRPIRKLAGPPILFLHRAPLRSHDSPDAFGRASLTVTNRY